MSRKSKKIVVPTDQEVAQYGGEPAPGQEAGSPPAAGQDDETTPEAQTPEAAADPRTEAEQWKEKCLRAKAELANYQRRVERDRAQALRYANAQLARALLPILDDLERVIKSGAEQAGDVESVVNGVQLTLDNLLKVLGEFNVSPIEAAGQPFDPAMHEAMTQQPSAEHSEPTVLEEVTKGYRLHDRVLRPARVIVSRPIAGFAEHEGDTGQGSESAADAGGD